MSGFSPRPLLYFYEVYSHNFFLAKQLIVIKLKLKLTDHTTIAFARTVAVVVPSPATSFVLDAAWRIKATPVFSM